LLVPIENKTTKIYHQELVFYSTECKFKQVLKLLAAGEVNFTVIISNIKPYTL